MNNMDHRDTLTYFIGAFVDELAKAGVADVVISPGSRSTPLSVLFKDSEMFNTYLHVDERSAAFFALGIAKSKQKPVVLVCTSGSAAANYFPAIVEASHSRIPLLVITADRPHELREVGAPQAMNQTELYGSFAKWYVDTLLPDTFDKSYAYIRTVANRAVATASTKPEGVVHLNMPLREPLLPNLELEDIYTYGAKKTCCHTNYYSGNRIPNEEAVQRLGRTLETKSGIILCGPENNDEYVEAILKLSETYNLPVLADPLSHVRKFKHDNVISGYDTILRSDGAKKALKPEFIIRFGAMPVSKFLGQLLENNRQSEVFIIDSGDEWRDPTLEASSMIYSDEVALCEALRNLEVREHDTQLNTLNQWKYANETIINIAEDFCFTHPEMEGYIYKTLLDNIEDGSALFVSNSMPIRDIDSFYLNNKDIDVFANRGVNGIDGIISTSLGVSTEYTKTYLVIGDLAFFHDLNGLYLANANNLSLTVILINNNGGGIFSFLPQYGEKKHFEALFGTPLNVDFSHGVKMYGGHYIKVDNPEDFNEALQQTSNQEGLKVIEIVTERESNMQLHREFWSIVSDSLNSYFQKD
jgi:2-succinyl-5-enolpyruvyl-6-hydroxy-3-cyclohexene-1-carboxylate synthase